MKLWAIGLVAMVAGSGNLGDDYCEERAMLVCKVRVDGRAVFCGLGSMDVVERYREQINSDAFKRKVISDESVEIEAKPFVLKHANRIVMELVARAKDEDTARRTLEDYLQAAIAFVDERESERMQKTISQLSKNVLILERGLAKAKKRVDAFRTAEAEEELALTERMLEGAKIDVENARKSCNNRTGHFLERYSDEADADCSGG